MARILPFLWYSDKAEEAAAFYVSLLPDSRINSVTTLPAAGSATVVEFTLAGQPFVAMAAGGHDRFNHAVSMMVNCDTQAEIDRLWEALSEGGSVEECGWLKDRYGLSWQIVPTMLMEAQRDQDSAGARRVTDAMLTMTKFDISRLEEARDGK